MGGGRDSLMYALNSDGSRRSLNKVETVHKGAAAGSGRDGLMFALNSGRAVARLKHTLALLTNLDRCCWGWMTMMVMVLHLEWTISCLQG